MSGSFVYKILSILKYSGSASSPISLLTAEELEKIFEGIGSNLCLTPSSNDNLKLTKKKQEER